MHEEKLNHIRHTLAHLLAASVRALYPTAENSIGPAIDNGFYQDFELPETVSEKDFPTIEAKMNEILATWKDFSKREVTKDEAKNEFSWNKYKLELINEFSEKGDQLTFYTAGAFVDLCRGGHVEHPDTDILPGSWKLDRVAGAYWRGDEKNKMLTRIYGLAFESKEKLDEYILVQEEAEKRDHRKLGKELDLFIFSDVVGKGLPLWTDKGATVRRELERFIVDEELRRGYLHVYTPDIARLDLYRKSGHYPYYKESMYAPIVIDEDEFMLRPMTCPHHFELYLSKPRSYKELPMRIGELAKLYRYEQSGELSGLIRVRGFCLADAHIVCKDSSQAADEVNGALDLIEFIAKTFGLEMGKNFWYRLSLGDRTDEKKYFKDDASWDEAEQKLREVLVARKAHFVEAPAEAAFYGPKIDVQMKNVRGKDDTAFTVQYDFVMPKRFELAYTDHEGKQREPIVVHRSSIGAIERIMAFLIEHFSGAFPTWLSPLQVKVLPVSEKQAGYAKAISTHLFESGIRAKLDDGNDTLGKRIREAKKEKVPYIIVVGDREMAENIITIETREGKKIEAVKIDTFLENIQNEIKLHSLSLMD